MEDFTESKVPSAARILSAMAFAFFILVSFILGVTGKPWLPGAMLTFAVFWAVTSSFKKQWYRMRFWKYLFIAFVVHLLLVWRLLALNLDAKGFQFLLIVGLIETLVITIGLAIVLGGRNFLGKID